MLVVLSFDQWGKRRGWGGDWGRCLPEISEERRHALDRRYVQQNSKFRHQSNETQKGSHTKKQLARPELLNILLLYRIII